MRKPAGAMAMANSGLAKLKTASGS
jgi:hypothetical protein